MKQYDEMKQTSNVPNESKSADGEVDETTGNVTEQVTEKRLGFNDNSDLIPLKLDEKKKVC